MTNYVRGLVCVINIDNHNAVSAIGFNFRLINFNVTSLFMRKVRRSRILDMLCIRSL